MSDLNILEQVDLRPYTTWRIGGPARWFVEPAAGQLAETLRFARKQRTRCFIIGRGSNLLVDSAGLDALVISTRAMNHLRVEATTVHVGAGVYLPKLSRELARLGWRGFEFLVGIPGSIGGAVAMNAGLTVFRPREMKDIVLDFQTMDSQGRIKTLTMADVHAGYRKTDLQESGEIVLKARLGLRQADNPDDVQKDTIAHLQERKCKQPLHRPTAGSVFQSPPGPYSAGWYIESTGLKGFRIGDAQVSHKHANWIENVGKASSSDVLRLMDHIATTVERAHGVILIPEVKVLSNSNPGRRW